MQAEQGIIVGKQGICREFSPSGRNRPKIPCWPATIPYPRTLTCPIAGLAQPDSWAQCRQLLDQACGLAPNTVMNGWGGRSASAIRLPEASRLAVAFQSHRSRDVGNPAAGAGKPFLIMGQPSPAAISRMRAAGATTLRPNSSKRRRMSRAATAI